MGLSIRAYARHRGVSDAAVRKAIAAGRITPEADGTYPARTKYALISVVIHEVGHNYFPMIVNSDERQWTWMDEGLNSFLQYLAEREWEADFPFAGAEPRGIVEYLQSSTQDPIMTNSESVQQLGPNAYSKPATGLNILRETILGRELFDMAFKEYARRWKFKRPEPADFFRTMEDASGVDLDWFWRGWFYSTDYADQAIESVKLYTVDTRNPEVEKPRQKTERDAAPDSLSEQRNASLPKVLDAASRYSQRPTDEQMADLAQRAKLTTLFAG